MKHFILLLFIAPCLSAQTPFRTDSALSYLKAISVTIGARPMGSINEQKGMDFALSRFCEFGLNEAYIMRMTAADNVIARSSINTNSGIAVGVLHGKTNRIIVIGAHIDSADPLIPGANDDGSGAATVIELARVLSKEQLQSTIVFCLFGGEESGLCGSNYFVHHSPFMDSVSLMLQIDMANGSETLIPTIKGEDGNSPKWLVQAAYEELSRLGYSGLSYPVHFFTAMGDLPGGGVTSDHDPFLSKGIPAISFSSDFDDPIHTPQDDYWHFKPEGLKRSGDLAYSLVHRFDNSVPEEKTGDYYLFQIGDRPLFFPLWSLYVFTLAAIAFSIAALIIVRKKRVETDRFNRPKIPALKLFLFAVLIQTLVWSSEYLVGIIKGVRYPWITFPEGYFILGFIAALLGITISLNLSPRLNLSKDPYRWFLRTVVFLLIFVFLFSLLGVKTAIYPSFALLFLSLSMVVRRPWLKFLFWIISPHFMFRLVFSEGFIFMGRSMALHSTQDLWMYFVLNVFYVLFFALWSFPFLLGFAASYFDSKTDLLRLKLLRTGKGFIMILSAFIVWAVVLSMTPSYSDEWRSNINVEQSVNSMTGEGTITLNSSEYLKNLKMHLIDKDTVISTWDRHAVIKKIYQPSWIEIKRKITTSADSNTTFDISLNLDFKYPPEELTISYTAGKSGIKGAIGPYISSTTGRSVTMRWKASTSKLISIPVCFTAVKSDSITETIEAKFMEAIEPVQIDREYTNIIPVTVFHRTEVLSRQVKD